VKVHPTFHISHHKKRVNPTNQIVAKLKYFGKAFHNKITRSYGRMRKSNQKGK
jgi:ATP phosphoribosyltransferase regulatory subunit HisZ